MEIFLCWSAITNYTDVTVSDRSLVDDKISSMDEITKENAKTVENLRDLNSKLIGKVKEQVKDEIEEHGKLIKENAFEIGIVRDQVREMADNIRDNVANKEDLETGLQEATDKMDEKAGQIFYSFNPIAAAGCVLLVLNLSVVRQIAGNSRACFQFSL